MKRALFRTEQVYEIIRKNAGSKTALDIAYEIGCSKSHLLGIASEIGVSLKFDPEKEKKLQFIRDNHHRMTANEAAKKIRSNPATLVKYASEIGLKFKRVKKPYKKQGRRFEQIDTSNGFFKPGMMKDWIAGFTY